MDKEQVYGKLIEELLPRITRELRIMEQEFSSRKSTGTSYMDKAASYLGEPVRDNSNAPSERHKESYFGSFIIIPIKHHIDIHEKGIEYLRTIDSPDHADFENGNLAKEVLMGSLEHWFQEPFEGTTLGEYFKPYVR